MAVAITLSTGERIYVNPGVSSATATIMCWLRWAGTGGVWQASMCLNAGSASTDPHMFIGRRNSDYRPGTADGGTPVWQTIAANTWYHLFIANTSGGNALFGLRTESGAYSTQTLAGDDVTPDRLEVGNDGYETASSQSFSIANIMVFNRALVTAEVDVQSRFTWPVMPDCNLCRPMFSEALIDLDLAGLSTPWTQTNIDAGDITDTALLPRSIVVQRPPLWTPAAAGGAPPAGAIMNQLQKANLGADLFNGTIQ